MAAQRGDESTISVKRAASRSRLMIEDHLMTPPVSQIASDAPNPIKLGTRNKRGSLKSVGTRETAHYAISHSAGVRFQTKCAIPEGQPADLRYHVPACATSIAQRISLGMPRHAAARKRRQLGCPAADSRRVWVLAWLHVYFAGGGLYGVDKAVRTKEQVDHRPSFFLSYWCEN
jgi:hypothetical protein